MNCENCGDEHDGQYGSGRFCSSKCARSFSTKRDRKSISEKVSAALKGHNDFGGGFKKGYDPRRKIATDFDREKAIESKRQIRKKNYSEMNLDDLPLAEKRRRVLAQQNGRCLWCGISEWRNAPLTLELDHINGNDKDNSYINLRILCPNCHSQTPTFRHRKRNATVVQTVERLPEEQDVSGSIPDGGTMGR